MYGPISAEQYDMWSAEQCADMEIVDGMVLPSPRTSARHNRLARVIANTLDAAGGAEWNADTGFDVRMYRHPAEQPTARRHRLPS